MSLVWLAGAGCARPALAPRAAISSESDPPLTVGTYNVHWLADPPGLRRVLAELSHVNVWCFQEVRLPPRGDPEPVLKRILPPGAWHVVAVRANRLGEIGSADWEAQAIVSRFPVAECRTWELDHSGAKRRVALAARIEVAGHSVWVVDTDHEPSFFAWRDRNLAQVRALAMQLAALRDARVVLAGDFNCSGNLWRGYGNDAHVRRIDARLVAVGLRPVDDDRATFTAGPLALRLDRMYLRGVRARGHGVYESRASDHRPVWCSVDMAPQ